MQLDRDASDAQRLVYREKAYLYLGVPLLALGLFLLSGSLFSFFMHWINGEPIFGKHGFQPIFFGLLLEVGILVVGVRSCTARQIVFDRPYHRIKKSKSVLFWKQSEVYDIRDFDTASWRSESKSDGEDREVRFPVSLAGSGGRVDLFEATSEEDARQAAVEIGEFLQVEQEQAEDVYVPAQGSIPVPTGAAIYMVRGFIAVWYLFCTIFIVMGLGFAGTAGWAVLQGKMELGDGLAFVGGSLIFTGMAIAFIFVGRKAFPTMLERLQAETAREKANRKSTEKKAAELGQSASEGGSGFSGGTEASIWRHLKWLVIIPGLLMGCETQVGVTHEGDEVAIREGLIFPWNDHPSAKELVKEIDREKYASLRVSRTYGFGIYSSSSSADVPGSSSKRRSAAKGSPARRSTAKSAPERASSPPLVVAAAGSDVLSINIDEQFQFVRRGFPLKLGVGQSNAFGLEQEPLEVLRREPDYETVDVSYGYIPLGNSDDPKFSFAVARTPLGEWFLYCDSNNNEDLTDDGPPLGNMGSGKLAVTLSLDVEVLSESRERRNRPYRIWLWLTKKESPRFYAVCHYKRRISIAGTPFVAVAFESSNHDVLYKEDGLWIDLDSDRRLNRENEHFMDGDSIEVAGKQYILQLDYP